MTTYLYIPYCPIFDIHYPIWYILLLNNKQLYLLKLLGKFTSVRQAGIQFKIPLRANVYLHV